MTLNAVRSKGRRRPACWFFSLLLIVTLTGCDGWSSVTNHYITCRGAGDSGRCEGGYGTLSGAYPETIETGFSSSGDAVEVRAEASVEQGRVNVSIESPEGDITEAKAPPEGPAVFQGLVEWRASTRSSM